MKSTSKSLPLLNSILDCLYCSGLNMDLKVNMNPLVMKHIAINSASPITKRMLDKYHEQCKIICQSSEMPYQYTFDEALSLKLYTDESEFTWLLRKAFWTNCSTSTRQEFYHWATTIYKTCLYHSRPLPRHITSKTTP
eukprot:1129922_1